MKSRLIWFPSSCSELLCPLFLLFPASQNYSRTEVQEPRNCMSNVAHTFFKRKVHSLRLCIKSVLRHNSLALLTQARGAFFVCFVAKELQLEYGFPHHKISKFLVKYHQYYSRENKDYLLCILYISYG